MKLYLKAILMDLSLEKKNFVGKEAWWLIVELKLSVSKEFCRCLNEKL